MKYYSLMGKAPSVHFREATLAGLAPDGGLYFPEEIPSLSSIYIDALHDMSPEEIGLEVMRPYIGGDIPDMELGRIIRETISFPIPLRPVAKGIQSLELFHGPTFAFKDVGARFMSRCLGYFSQDNKRPALVLVATSGDTGGAVADGFFGVEGVNVVILYPSGKVSPVQEKQLTTYGNNIHALEVSGDFDACQRLVKQAFSDQSLRSELFLTSANSINIARWLPQQIYFFLGLKQWQGQVPPVIAVPSGNFGNICAGMMAWRAGLPVKHFIAACNANRTVPEYLLTGNYQPRQSVQTISNAMDVGDPSNFMRVLSMFGHSHQAISKMVSAISIDDRLTEDTMARVYHEQGYMLDPHSAVAFAALKQYAECVPEDAQGFILGTAHPAKFPESVAKATGQDPELPIQASALMQREKRSTRIDTDYSGFRLLLREKFTDSRS